MFASRHERPSTTFLRLFFRCCSTDGPIRAGDAGSCEIGCRQCRGRESRAFGPFRWDRRRCSHSLRRRRRNHHRHRGLPRPQIFCPTIFHECCRCPYLLLLRLLMPLPRRIQGIHGQHCITLFYYYDFCRKFSRNESLISYFDMAQCHGVIIL